MKKFIFIILALLLSASPSLAQHYFPDIVMTGKGGLWTDSRAYVDLEAAITMIGADDRTLVISSQENCAALTIPSNITLRFEREGSINNSGQLIINTKKIEAADNQIFTGAGDIDFASGTVARTSWFSDFEKSIDVTSDDSVTLVVSDPATINADCAVGNNVTLKWESTNNIITTVVGTTLSNLNSITAPSFQLFAGAGDFDFLAGSQLKSSWFSSLRSADTFTDDEDVDLTIIIDRPEEVTWDITFDQYQGLKINKGYIITVTAGDTITLNGSLNADISQIFDGDGLVVLGSYITNVYPEWWEIDGVADEVQIDAADTAMTDGTIILSVHGNYAIDDDITISNVLQIKNGAILSIDSGKTLTINGPLELGLYQGFSGDGHIRFGSKAVKEAYPQWFGAKGDDPGDGTGTDDTDAINACASALRQTNAYDPTTGNLIFPETGAWYLASGAIDLASIRHVDMQAFGILSSYTGGPAVVMGSGMGHGGIFNGYYNMFVSRPGTTGWPMFSTSTNYLTTYHSRHWPYVTIATDWSEANECTGIKIRGIQYTEAHLGATGFWLGVDITSEDNAGHSSAVTMNHIWITRISNCKNGVRLFNNTDPGYGYVNANTIYGGVFGPNYDASGLLSDGDLKSNSAIIFRCDRPSSSGCTDNRWLYPTFHYTDTAPDTLNNVTYLVLLINAYKNIVKEIVYQEGDMDYIFKEEANANGGNSCASNVLEVGQDFHCPSIVLDRDADGSLSKNGYPHSIVFAKRFIHNGSLGGEASDDTDYPIGPDTFSPTSRGISDNISVAPPYYFIGITAGDYGNLYTSISRDVNHYFDYTIGHRAFVLQDYVLGKLIRVKRSITGDLPQFEFRPHNFEQDNNLSDYYYSAHLFLYDQSRVLIDDSDPSDKLNYEAAWNYQAGGYYTSKQFSLNKAYVGLRESGDSVGYTAIAYGAPSDGDLVLNGIEVRARGHHYRFFETDRRGSKSKSSTAMGLVVSSGSFTLSNLLSFLTVYDFGISTSSTCHVFLFPANASAGVLSAGASALYEDPASRNDEYSFVVRTADGSNPVGTEVFSYIIVDK